MSVRVRVQYFDLVFGLGDCAAVLTRPESHSVKVVKDNKHGCYGGNGSGGGVGRLLVVVILVGVVVGGGVLEVRHGQIKVFGSRVAARIQYDSTQ